MFDHIGLGVPNLTQSKTFFLKALAPLKVALVMEGPHGVGIGKNGMPSFWLHQSTVEPVQLHIAFAAETRAQVDAFYEAAIAAGGKDNGKPGIREKYHPDYYGAFVIDPSGNNVEAVCHKPEA